MEFFCLSRKSLMADERPFTTAPATAGELIDGAKDAYFEVDGVVLHYVEVGEGPLIIFYHGFPLFWFSFHHQMNACLLYTSPSPRDS